MSKAPKQRKAHYQPYQTSGVGALGAGTGAMLSGSATMNTTPAAAATTTTEGGGGGILDVQAAELALQMQMDPVLAGFSSSHFSRNLWDDWNENDVKFDMFASDDGLSTTVSATSSAMSSGANSTVAVETSSGALHAQLQRSMATHHVALEQAHGAGLVGFEPMDLDATPRIDVKRSLSEDLVSMLDDDDDAMNGPFGSRPHAPVYGNQLPLPTGLGHYQAPLNHDQAPHHHHQHQVASSSLLDAGQRHHSSGPPTPQQDPPQTPQHVGAQNAAPWLHGLGGSGGVPVEGFPATPPPPLGQRQQQQQQLQPSLAVASRPLSPTTTSRLEANKQRPDPSPMAKLSAAVATTMHAVPNPCKENEAEITGAPANASTPSPFNAYSLMAAATAAMDPTTSGDKGSATPGAGAGAMGPFAAHHGMMMPGFMMYSMPMLGNFPMGMMPMGMAMNGMLGPMGVPMGMQMGMPMNPMAAAAAAAAMGVGPLGAMGVPPTDGTGGPAHPNGLVAPDPSIAPAPKIKTLQPKDVGGGGAATFVSIARKPEEPEVSSILKSLMEEEAKKKEKKLERNRDSARESRKKQQTYVETLETGIKRLQINRELVVSYRWGLTGPSLRSRQSLPSDRDRELAEWRERLPVVTGATEAFAHLHNPASFQNLMRMNRQRRVLSLARADKARAILKCFVNVGRMLDALRRRVLELQVFRRLGSSPIGDELARTLALSEDQVLRLQCHSNRIFAQEVVALVRLFKAFFALRAHARALDLMSPSLENYFREVCSLDQLHKLLQWTELHRPTIEGIMEQQPQEQQQSPSPAGARGE